MTERVIATRFTADVNAYIRNTSAAARATRDQAQASTEVGTAMLAMGTVAAVGIGIAVAKFAEFDQAISNVKAATQESTENMGLLREAALEAGASSVFSATEAANAIEELGKAGLSTAQILDGGLDGALSLAAAGQLGVAEAASIAAISVKQFNLAGADVPHVADLLAAGAGKAVGDVTDLAAALGQAGLVANSTGLSIEETTGVLAAFADKGLLGSDAGTSLKSMLQALVPTSKEASKEMERLGISAFDANGEFIGAAQFAGNYKNALKDLNPEQQATTAKIIFGSDAVRAANVFYDLGAEGIGKYIDQTNDSGYAAKVAADRLNNLSGDVEALGGAFDTYMIKSGSGANDMLRSLIQGTTGLISSVGELPEPVLGGALAIGGLVTAVVLAGGAALVAVPKIAAFKTSLSTMGISGRTAAISVGAMAGGLAVAGVAFSLFAAKQARATASTQEFKDSLNPATGAITAYTRELIAKKLAESGAYGNAMTSAGISQKELTDAVVKGGDALKTVQDKLSKENTFVSFFDGTGIAAGNASSAIVEVSRAFEKSADEWEDQAAAAEETVVPMENASEAYETAATQASELESNLSALIETMNKANGIGQDAESQNLAYQESLAAIDEQIKAVAEGAEGYAAGLDIATEAGRENRSMLLDLADSSQGAAEAQYNLDGNTANYKATLEAGRQAVIDRATALGATAEEAQTLADKIYAIPSDAEFKMIADTADAAARLQRIQDLIDGIGGTMTSHVATGDGGGGITRATGGAIVGPGTGTSDSIPARLSNGEHVLTAEDVRAMGGQGGVYAFRRDLYQGFAKGGAVRYATAPAGGGNSSSSVTNRNVNQTWNVTSNGDDPSTLAAKIDGQVNWSMRGLS